MTERKYFEINEDSARRAHDMMSMSDYRDGSKTAEYRRYADEAYDVVDRIEQERPEAVGKAYSIAVRYAKKLADNMNAESRIGCMCPSVMIAGPANFPTKKKERQNRAWDSNMQEFREVRKTIEKLNAILRGKDVIQSDDENAIEKLEKKLNSMKTMQEKMKAANKAIRMKDQTKGDATLREMGYTDPEIKELRAPDFCGRVGYPGYMLTNNNANIHRVEDRLKNLKATKEQETTEAEHEGFKVVENTEAMRLQIIFDDKPEAEVREVLKSNGFRWAPSQNAWQRQLTPNARRAAECAIKKIEEMGAIE